MLDFHSFYNFKSSNIPEKCVLSSYFSPSREDLASLHRAIYIYSGYCSAISYTIR